MLCALPLQPWASRRREDLFKLRSMLNEQIAALDQAVKKAAEENDRARLLMTQPGVGPITSMAFVLTLGDVSRFPRGKQVASYLGLIPREYSSGGHQRFGSISKQGNRFLRMLLVEAAQCVVRYDPEFRNEYLHRCHTKPRGRGEGGSGKEIDRAIVLDAEDEYGVSRDRSRREQLAGAPGQRKLGRDLDWALSSR